MGTRLTVATVRWAPSQCVCVGGRTWEAQDHIGERQQPPRSLSILAVALTPALGLQAPAAAASHLESPGQTATLMKTLPKAGPGDSIWSATWFYSERASVGWLSGGGGGGEWGLAFRRQDVLTSSSIGQAEGLCRAPQERWAIRCPMGTECLCPPRYVG